MNHLEESIVIYNRKLDENQKEYADFINRYNDMVKRYNDLSSNKKSFLIVLDIR